GHGDIAVFNCEAQGYKALDHVGVGNVSADECAHFVRLKGQNTRLFGVGVGVDHAADDFAGAQHFDQLAGAQQGGHGVFAVQTLFKAARGLGAHSDAARRDADAGTGECGAFKDHHFGVFSDFAVFTAHDAGNAHGLDRVGDEQRLGRDTALLAVQRGDNFVRPAAAHDDFVLLDAGIVKSVHGLAIFQHDIVGDIDNVVDGTHAGVA